MIKRLLAALFLLASPVLAGTPTPRLGLQKPDFHGTRWDLPILSNYDILDSSSAVLSSTQTFSARQDFTAAIRMRGTGIVFNDIGLTKTASIQNLGNNKSELTVFAQDGVFLHGNYFSPSAELNIFGSNNSTYGSFSVVGSSADTSTAYSGFQATSPISQSNLWSLPTKDGSANQPLVTNGTSNLSFLSLTPNQCVQTDANGALATTGSSCGSGGGGGSSTLGWFKDGVQITSPTAQVNTFGNDIQATSHGTTVYLALNPSTTDFVHNGTSSQPGEFNLTRGQFGGSNLGFGASAISVDGWTSSALGLIEINMGSAQYGVAIETTTNSAVGGYFINNDKDYVTTSILKDRNGALFATSDVTALSANIVPLTMKAANSNVPETSVSVVLRSTGVAISSDVYVTGNVSVSNLASGRCVQTGTGGLLSVTGSACGSGGGSGGYALEAATVTIQANVGLTASTGTFGSASSTALGNNSWATINSSGTSQNLTLNVNGQPSGGLQNQKGGLTINALGPAGPAIDVMVIHSSYTSAQAGSSIIGIWQDNSLRNDPDIWIHDVSNNSGPDIRIDRPSPNIEMVNTSTDNAHGYGKWEPFASAYQSIDMQCGSNRAYDNSTFENLCYLHPLDALDSPPGPYYHAQDRTNDSGVLASSDTSAVSFYTLNSHTVGLTGPANNTASYTFGLPDTVGSTGNLWYNSGSRGGNFSVRQMKHTGSDFTYSPTTGVSISTISVSSFTSTGGGNFSGTGDGGISFTIGNSTFGAISSTTPIPSGHFLTGGGTNYTAIDGGILLATQTATVSISSGTGFNGLTVPGWRSPTNTAITIVKILAETLPAGTTVLYQLESRPFGSINSAGTNTFSVAFSTANNTGVTTTSFANTAIPAQSNIIVTTPAAGASAGSPTWLTFTIYYNRNTQ